MQNHAYVCYACLIKYRRFKRANATYQYVIRYKQPPKVDDTSPAADNTLREKFAQSFLEQENL